MLVVISDGNMHTLTFGVPTTPSRYSPDDFETNTAWVFIPFASPLTAKNQDGVTSLKMINSAEDNYIANILVQKLIKLNFVTQTDSEGTYDISATATM